ncbi:MAG: hypothetical protein ACR2H5_19585 [Ktedonobacteraceae bacterium]
MHFYQSDSGQEEAYHQFAAVPLPGAAVVIDVRETSEYDFHLLDYLAIEVEDLAREMRLNQVPRWRHLAGCIDFLHLKVQAPHASLHEGSDFVLTTRHEQQIPVHSLNDLASFVGRDYLDCVRNHRIRAIQDTNDERDDNEAVYIDPEQPTVRVFFLADMEQKDSIQRAMSYAQCFKQWMEEQHGPKRFNQDDCIQVILLCLNADVTLKPDILFPTSKKDTTRQDMAIDLCLLLQKYRDDAAYIGGEEQVLHVELLLYTLLLYWPQVFEHTIDDVQELEAVALINKGYELPCPVYTLGIAAREYSARWAVHWLDYGVTAKLLQVLGDNKVMEPEDVRDISENIKKWLRTWQKELKDILAAEAVVEIDDLQVYGTLQQRLRDTTFQRSTPTNSLEALSTFYQGLSELYVGPGDNTLQHAMAKAGASITSQFKWVSTQHAQSDQDRAHDESQASEFYEKLTGSYSKIRQFLSLHFQGASGALPRAVCQLSALTKEAERLRAIEQNPPNIEQCQKKLIAEGEEAYKKLQKHLQLWQIPVLGDVLRSTIASVVVMVVVGVGLIAGVNWGIGQAHLFPNSSFDILHAFDSASNMLLLAINAVLVVLVVFCEFLYLAARNRALRKERDTIHRQLRNTVQGHFAMVQDVIAARVALKFLQWSDLYVPGESMSPYEQRLKKLLAQVQRTQEQATQHQSMVDERIKPLLKWQYPGTEEASRWPDLTNRTDLLPWEQLEDAFLRSCQEVTAGSLPLNLLSEMLLRRLGKEKPTNILQDIMHRRLAGARKDSEEQFQALTVMLVTVVLALDIVQPDVSEIVPLLQQYVTLQERHPADTAVMGMELSGVQRALKEAVLAQALPGRTNLPSPLQRTMATMDVEEVLATWVGFQHKSDPTLEHILTANDVVYNLVERQETFAQVLDSLRLQSTLLGYRDDMTSEDYTYLLLAPGEASEEFLRANDGKNALLIRPVMFPDKEKLVYMHIHRIRQLSTDVLLATKKRV